MERLIKLWNIEIIYYNHSYPGLPGVMVGIAFAVDLKSFDGFHELVSKESEVDGECRFKSVWQCHIVFIWEIVYIVYVLRFMYMLNISQIRIM